MAESRFPTSPLDLDTTKALLQEKIDAGEILQSDIDLLKRGYRWMMLSSVVGAAVGIPVYIVVGKKKPPVPVWRKLAFASFASSSCSFLGFTLGGAAAALEVNNSMVDSQRKMRVFQKVMYESKLLADNRHLGTPMPASFRNRPTAPGAARGVDENGDSVWDPERAEKGREAEREAEVDKGVRNEVVDDRDTSNSPIRAATTNTWDKLRHQNPLTPASTSSFPSSATTSSSLPTRTAGMSEREREQAEFDKLLEKERNVGDEGFGKEWK